MAVSAVTGIELFVVRVYRNGVIAGVTIVGNIGGQVTGDIAVRGWNAGDIVTGQAGQHAEFRTDRTAADGGGIHTATVTAAFFAYPAL